MTTTQPTTAAREYLDRVRDLLSDLPEEERIELVQDLTAHLDELGGDIEGELGSPEAFAAEFRAMAGLEVPPDPRTGLLDVWESRWDAIRESRAVSGLGERWPDVRPVWVGVRGWMLVAVPAALYSDGAAFRAFPIPEVGHSSLGGVLVVTLVTMASLAVDKRAQGGAFGWRWVNAAINLVLAVLLVAGLVGGTLYTPAGVADQQRVAEQWIRDEIAVLLPRDLIATTPDGSRLDGVRLYDEEGQPFDLARIRWEMGLAFPAAEIEHVEPPGEQPENLYPLSERQVTPGARGVEGGTSGQTTTTLGG